MAKRRNEDAIMIKKLLKKGWSQKKIATFLNISKQKVNYWVFHEIKETQIRSVKLKDIYIDRIIKWAKNKTTSIMSCRKLARMINSVLEKKMKEIKQVKLLL